MSSQQTSSKLRDLAWAYGQWHGFAGAVVGIGIATVGTGILVAIRQAHLVWLWILLLALGAALVVFIPLIARRKIATITQRKSPKLSRAVESVAGGMGGAIILSAIGIVLASIALNPWWQQGLKGMVSIFAVYALTVLLVGSVFVVPGYFAQRARRDFRRYIDANPALKKELEAMSLTWVDPVANRDFGPL